MKNDENMVFEVPFRPAYEISAAAGWGSAAGLCAVLAHSATLPMATLLATGGGCCGMAAIRLFQGITRYRQRESLWSSQLTFLPLAEAMPIYRAAIARDELWMGYGFDWTVSATEQAYHIARQGLDQVVKTPWRRQRAARGPHQGAYWLHALAAEQEITMPLGNTYGHVLIFGTTRAGKTRLFDNLITQAILRGEAVIIIDPKGDHDLRKNAERACRAMGQPERFVYFHPAYPETSACLDPLRNFNRGTELASRISALITKADGGADAFASFCWLALNTVIGGLHLIGERASLVKIRQYIESGIQPLALQGLRQYCEKHGNRDELSGFTANAKNNEIVGYINFYERVLVPRGLAHPDVGGLISMYHHDKDHFGKMVASLVPILSMLTSGPLKDMLSPTPGEGDNIITDTGRIIKNKQVLYIGLDSLSDSQVGTAIGALLLSDMVAVAGDRYNYGVGETPVNLFVDEAAEIINQPLIQLMNKGGGALIRVNIATQTVADLEARLGSKPRAEQVMGNANTVFALRVNDGATQKYLAEALPKVRVRQIQKQYSQGVGSTIQSSFSGGYSESLQDTSDYAITAANYGSLPPLHYFARLPGGRLVKGRVPILTE